MSRLRRPIAFLGVGLASAAVDAGVFAAAFALGAPAALASAVGFGAAFGVNYVGNRAVVFRVRHSTAALTRYLLLVGFNLLLSTGIVGALVVAGVQPHLSKLTSMVVIAGLNYWVMRRWVFRAPQPAPAG